jgi:hypothetical protein
MRQAWSDTLSLDRVRNASLLEAALPPAAPVTLVEGAVWTPRDDSLETRLEHRAMSLLAERLKADPRLAAAWRELVNPIHGVVQEARA